MFVLKGVLFAVVALILAYHPLKVFQRASYRVGEWVVALFYRPWLMTAYAAISAVGCFLQVAFPQWLPLCAGIAIGFGAFLAIARRKTPLVFTKRLLRFFCFFLPLTAGCAVWCCFAPIFCLSLPFPFLAIPLAACLQSPLEARICRSYERQAKQKLARIQPIVIAVTGSYGKTTFKNVLANLLSTRYRVCASPASYNTPQGLAITVNNYLKEDDQILIVEFGARYRGDIERLCRLIPPDLAVLTAVGNQHLQTFGSVEALKKEKFSLFSHCKQAGFFNGEDENVRNLYFSYPKTKFLSGTDGSVAYANVTETNSLLTFDVFSDGSVTNMTCPLTASYMPSMIVLALSVSKYLNCPFSSLKEVVATLKPVAHRLELVYNGKDVILDDAYNANENGFRSAVDLLAKQTGRTRVMITPGVVELGCAQYEVNRELAAYAAQKIDCILTYGVNAKAIKEGGADKTLVFRSLKGCMAHYQTIKGERAVLFENDLPDTY